MLVAVTTEARFAATPDGACWTDGPFAYPFWTRYLEVFQAVRIVARVRPVLVPPPRGLRVDGQGVSLAAVPYYVGPWQYLKRARPVRRVLVESVNPGDAAILRVPSQLAAILFSQLRAKGHPYAVEVVGDPYDAFAPGAIRHPLRPLIRWQFARQQRLHCRHAAAAAYVTAHALQHRYPPGPGTHSVHYSDVELNRLAEAPRAVRSQPEWRLITVGSLAHLYKAQDVLIDAVAVCNREGLNLRLVLVGDGKHRGELEARAATRGVRQQVEFRGQLPAGNPILHELQQADLFVLPSRQEGLPRAMLEAMAQALPCIGSTVGGIPELLPAEDLVPPDDSAALATKIREVLTSPDRMTRMSCRNLQTAANYQEEILATKRRAFYEFVRSMTNDWQRRRPA